MRKSFQILIQYTCKVSLSFWRTIYDYDEQPLTQHSFSQIRSSSPQIGESPTHTSYKIANSLEERRTIQIFLKHYFGNPPHTPLLQPIFQEDDILLYMTENSSSLSIISSIRYSYAGEFEEEAIYKIDCFCIHPEWRKKSVGTYLLSALHYETMRRGLKFSIFLKESHPIFSLKRPFYSSTYMFKEALSSSTIENLTVYKPSIEQVRRLIKVYMSIFPQTFTLINYKTTEWRLFKQEEYFLLIGCQNSFQEHPKTKTKIGWVTAWLESTTSTWRSDRSIIIDAVLSSFSYGWYWTDKRWIQNASGWKEDGPFHWYSYQWLPTIIPNGSYILSG